MEDQPIGKEEFTKVIDEIAEKTGLSHKVGKFCFICSGKILRDESGHVVFNPFYCEDCITDMQEKEMTPHQYAKEVHGVDLPKL